MFVERDAMMYYWWFMVVTAFSGTSILTSVLDTFNEAQIDESFKTLLFTIASTIPTKISATVGIWNKMLLCAKFD